MKIVWSVYISIGIGFPVTGALDHRLEPSALTCMSPVKR